MTTRIAAHENSALIAAQSISAKTMSSSAIGALRIEFPGLLHRHPRVRRVQRLEGRGERGADGDAARGQVLDVRQAVDLADQRADAVAERDQRDQRLGDVAEDARAGELLPDQEVAHHDRPEARREVRRRRRTRSAWSSSGVVADLPAGELEEQVLEVGRAVQVADAVVVGSASSSGFGVAQVEEDRLAAGLDALGERARARCAAAAAPSP